MTEPRWNTPAITAAMTAASENAVRVAAEHVRGVAVDRAPIDRGDLRNSATVTTDGTKAAVAFDTPYAVIQHEAMDFHHDTGEAKYLELAAEDNATEVLELIAAQLRRALR